MSTLTKEQREQWDKITGAGLYNVFGDGAYDYMCNRIRRMLFEGADLYTFLLIGAYEDKARFLKRMYELDVDADYFYFIPDREQADGEEYYANLNSEDDTEKFCNLIRQPKASGHHRIGAVVLLNVGEEIKHIDKILKVPVLMNGATRHHRYYRCSALRGGRIGECSNSRNDWGDRPTGSGVAVR
jgi:hypothetical protein